MIDDELLSNVVTENKEITEQAKIDLAIALITLKYTQSNSCLLYTSHFDLANNYGPEPGSAEINFGRILKDEMSAYRDEMIISTKAGYLMWDGPYGEWGSRKYMLASLDQSLKRLGLDYVDIFYHHRMDPETPLEESMGALDTAVKSGKALYAGISNYDGETMKKACEILKDLKCPFVINQNRYSIFDRTIDVYKRQRWSRGHEQEC